MTHSKERSTLKIFSNKGKSIPRRMDTKATRQFVTAILFTLIAAVSTSCGDKDVDKAKAYVIPKYPQMTIGACLDARLDGAEWSSSQEGGLKLITVTGEISQGLHDVAVANSEFMLGSMMKRVLFEGKLKNTDFLSLRETYHQAENELPVVVAHDKVENAYIKTTDK